jgi:hypothetical protein
VPVPDRDTRYEALYAGPPALTSATVAVAVNPTVTERTATKAHGEVMVSVVAVHSKAFDWNALPAYWFVKSGSGHSYHLVATTHTRDLSPGRTYVTATFYPPSGPYTYLVCFDAPGEMGLGVPGSTSHHCPHADFVAR